MKKLKRFLKSQSLNILVTIGILALMTWGFIAINSSLEDKCRPRQDKPLKVETVVEQAETKTLQVTATAYSNHYKCTGKTPSHPAYGITYTGTKTKQGRTIAVDKKVIPLGSTVIIDGKEYVAEDTGSGIKGNRIDIYFESFQDAKEFGVKKLEIEVMK